METPCIFDRPFNRNLTSKLKSVHKSHNHLQQDFVQQGTLTFISFTPISMEIVILPQLSTSKIIIVIAKTADVGGLLQAWNIWIFVIKYYNWWFLLWKEAIMCLPPNWHFAISKDEWHTKEDTDKSVKNALCDNGLGYRLDFLPFDIPSAREVPFGIPQYELCWSEGIRQLVR